MKTEKENKKISTELPPPFKTWKGLYWYVIAQHVFLIIIFYLFTKYFE